MLDLDNIPPVLTSYPHWVVWRYETRDGKTTKVPYNALTGGGAMSNTQSTWSTFEQAQERFYRDEQYNGLGFMLGVECCGLIGVDLDHCRDRETRDIADWAWDIVEALDTYTEISPSGEGLRCLGFGDLAHSQGLKRGPYENYNRRRFLTITGNALGIAGNQLRDITEPLKPIHRERWPELYEARPPIPQRHREPLCGCAVTDEEVWARIERSSDAKTKRLLLGDMSDYGNDHSRADVGLFQKLFFYTGGNREQAEYLFSTTPLMRDKWKRKDYRERQIKFATNNAAVYSPRTG